jgi:hypothetical protein
MMMFYASKKGGHSSTVSCGSVSPGSRLALNSTFLFKKFGIHDNRHR